MSQPLVIARIDGTYHTFEVTEHPGGFLTSTVYYVRRSDGKLWGSYPTRARAVEAAYEKAGPGARERG